MDTSTYTGEFNDREDGHPLEKGSIKRLSSIAPGRRMRGDLPYELDALHAGGDIGASRRELSFVHSQFPRLRKQWFLVGVALVICLAQVYPSLGVKGGPLRPEYSVKYGGVMLIFFNSGLSLKPRELRDALYAVRLHALIQIYSFMVIPFLMSMLVAWLRTSSIDSALLDGLLLVSALPPPVSSGVILTKAANGNEAAAIFNSTFGSFLGIVTTPILFRFLIGESTNSPSLSNVFVTLSITVILPLIFGQLTRFNIELRRDPALNGRILGFPFGTVNSVILLMIIYTVFCQTFSQKSTSVTGRSLFFVVIFIAFFQIAITLIMKRLAQHPMFSLSRADAVTAIFCSTHKSLTLGMPMLNVLITDPEKLSLVSIPLLVYHPMQILLGSLWVPSLNRWASEITMLEYSQGLV